MAPSHDLSTEKKYETEGDNKSVEGEQADETLFETLTSCRWILAYVGLICFTLIYALRINMGIAMVCMVLPSNTSTSINTGSSSSQCVAASGNSTSSPGVTGEIAWDKTLQGWILSSFFYGYLITQIPGGYLSGRFGGKRVMLGGLIIYGLVTLLVPVAARYDGKDFKTSAYLVIALRVIAGLATGVVFPAMHALFGKWAPKYERSKINTLCISGTMVGNVLMLGTGGFFCEWESFDGGWPSMFYLGGGICLLFCIVWAFTIYDSPSEHPRITEKEKSYIYSNIDKSQHEKNDFVPWLEMGKSPAVWAIIFAHCSNNFGNYTLMTKLPAFMKEVLKFDIKANGLFSTLPYIAMFIVANTVSHVIDKLREKGRLTTITARKVAMALALVIPAGILAGTGHIPCDKNYLGVVLLTVAVAFTGFNRSGYNVNPTDIAPKYAGELFGVSNTFATIPGMVAPVLVNALTPNGTAKEWQTVFYIWAGVFCLGAVVFAIFGQGELQPWAGEKDRSLKSRKLSTLSNDDVELSKISTYNDKQE